MKTRNKTDHKNKVPFKQRTGRNPVKGFSRLAFVLLALFLLASSLSGQEHLNRYLRMAAENNPGLQARFNEYMAALQVVPQEKVLPDPQVAFGYFISPVETRVGPQRLKVSASQMFPWFGTLRAKENAAVQAAKARFELFKEARSELFSDVKAVYYNLYFNRKSVAVTQENIRFLKTIQKLATVKVEAGVVSMADEYQVEMALNELQNQLALLRDEFRVLEGEFRNLLNAGDELTVHLPENLWRTGLQLSREAALDSVRTQNHQLLQLQFRQSALAYQEEVAALKGKPDLKIGLDYISVGKGENNLAGKNAFVFPTVGISIPLYRKKYRAMVEEATYLEAANQKRTEEKRNRLETLFDKAWKDYLDAGRRILLYETQLDLAAKALKILESEYATDKKNLEEILRMERKVLEYHLSFEKAKTDKQAAIAFMNYLMGK